MRKEEGDDGMDDDSLNDKDRDALQGAVDARDTSNAAEEANAAVSPLSNTTVRSSLLLEAPLIACELLFCFDLLSPLPRC